MCANDLFCAPHSLRSISDGECEHCLLDSLDLYTLITKYFLPIEPALANGNRRAGGAAYSGQKSEKFPSSQLHTLETNFSHDFQSFCSVVFGSILKPIKWVRERSHIQSTLRRARYRNRAHTRTKKEQKENRSAACWRGVGGSAAAPTAATAACCSCLILFCHTYCISIKCRLEMIMFYKHFAAPHGSLWSIVCRFTLDLRGAHFICQYYIFAMRFILSLSAPFSLFRLFFCPFFGFLSVHSGSVSSTASLWLQ